MFCGLGDKDGSEEEVTKKIQNYVYALKQPIGQGNFSEVFRGIDESTGRPVAIKVIKLASLTSRVAEQLLQNEIQVLKEINHENILQCYEVLTSKNNCYIITQFCEGGDLEKLLQKQKKFHEAEISKLVYDIYQGLLYLNSLGIVHRDLKVANIFITSTGCLKIADFGFAIKSYHPFKDINIGSPIYMSPEGLLLHQYGPKTDVWSFGVLIYELLHGDTPLATCRSEAELKERVLLPPKINQAISSDLKQFLNLCLTVDPKCRPDVKALLDTAYLRKVTYEMQKMYSLKEKTTMSLTTCTTTYGVAPYMKNVTTYDEGLAILQYCRLIHKTTELQKSMVLSQWLLNVMSKLQWIHMEKKHSQKGQKLVGIIKDYYSKYLKDHEDNKVEYGFEDVMRECQKYLSDPHNKAHSYLRTLVRQTEMLWKGLQQQKLGHYVKNTQVEHFLSSKQKKTTYTMFSK